MHRSACRGAHECLRIMLWELNEQKVEELFVFWSLFGVLEVKDGLDRTDKPAKIACIGMCHRMYFLDLQQLDRWPAELQRLI